VVETAATVPTERQPTVLERREAGVRQWAVCDELGTTASDVSAIERAAEDNIETDHRTLELVRILRALVQFVPSDTGSASPSG